MPLIKKDFVSRLRERSDVVEVLSDYLPLKKKGNDYWCCCPFHNEKTPSFSVSPDRGIYKCFSCGKGGDAFQFLLEKGLNYVEAVETLAAKYGMTIEYEKTNQSKEEIIRARDNREQGFEVLEQVCRFFESSLNQNQSAKDYLKNRGLGEEIIKEFRIGFSPSKYDFKALISIYNEELLEQVGVIKNNERGNYPFFRERIIFPIFNVKAKVIGFGARFIGSEEERKRLNTGKYINSPETLWFKKSDELYGLSNALNSPDKKREEVVVCEGYADVVQMHQQGIKNSVAALGTAFGEEHLRKLSKYYSTINFCFDGDEAGRKAAEKTLEIVFKNYDEKKFYKFTFLANRENPNEKEDPDSFLRKYGAEELKKELDKGLFAEEFLEKILDIKNLKNLSPSLKTKKDKEINQWLSYISDENSKAKIYKTNLIKRFESFGLTFSNVKIAYNNTESNKNFNQNNNDFIPKAYANNSNTTKLPAIFQNEEKEEIKTDELKANELKKITELPFEEKAFKKIKEEFSKKEERLIVYLVYYPQFHNFSEFTIYSEYIKRYFNLLDEILYLCRCGANKEFLKDFSSAKKYEFIEKQLNDGQLLFEEEKFHQEVKDFFVELVKRSEKLANIVEKNK